LTGGEPTSTGWRAPARGRGARARTRTPEHRRGAGEGVARV